MSDTKKDGGPSFPTEGKSGMSQRALIAAIALQGIIANEKIAPVDATFSALEIDTRCKAACEYADALLRRLNL